MKTPTLKSYFQYSERTVADVLYGLIEIVSSVEGTSDPDRAETGDFGARTIFVDAPVHCGVKEYFTGEITWDELRKRINGSLRKSLSVRPGFYSSNQESQ